MTRVLLCAALLVIWHHADGSKLSAQEPPVQQDTTLRQRLLQRLITQDPANVLEREAMRQQAARAQAGERPAPGVVTSRLPGGQRLPGAELADDSVAAAFLRLEQYQVTRFEGDGLRYDAAGGQVAITGSGMVLRDGQTMTADSLLTYDVERAVFCGYGQPVLSGGGSAPVSAERVCYDVNLRTGTALTARTEFTEGALWYFHGDEITPVDGRIIWGHGGRFTSCELDEPHYHFEARQMKLVHGDLLVARNVTLRFADVPVLWLPFMVQSMKQGRRSGLLTPRFSVNDIARTSSGYSRRVSNVGFFWAVNDYIGAETSLDWFSNHWTSLQGNARYRWEQQFLNGGLNFRRFWKAEGGSELTLASMNSWRPGENTNVMVNANFASSSRFVQERSFDPAELNRTLNSEARLSHRFDWGSLSLSGQRRQFLTQERVQLTLPSVGLSLSPVRFLAAPPASARWYNNLTWVGGTNFTLFQEDVDETAPSPSVRDRRTARGGANSSFTLGRFSWNQSFSADEQVLAAKPAVDTLPGLPREESQTFTWGTGISFQQRLVGTSTLRPTVRWDGRVLRSPKTDNEYLAAPTRFSLGAALTTDIYGFWPGIGPFTRMRHRVSPTFSYRYAPAVEATERQREVFGRFEASTQNQITISLRQTLEAKMPARETRPARPSGALPADELPPDSIAVADTLGPPDPQLVEQQPQPAEQQPQPGEPLEEERAMIVELFSLTTSAITYDFVRAREEGIGLTTTRLDNTVGSDLVPWLNLSFSHDLFDTAADDPETRRFSPHLSSLNASFRMSNASWLVRVLGLAGAAGRDVTAAEMPGAGRPGLRGEEQEIDIETGAQRGDHSLVGVRRGAGFGALPGGVGNWTASLNYTLQRPRATQNGYGSYDTQMLSGNLSLQATENWTMNWQTRYSVVDGEFTSHVLNLRRNLHRWEANFDFVKAQNGNFSFIFHARLRDNPDIKLDYEQRSVGYR